DDMSFDSVKHEHTNRGLVVIKKSDKSKNEVIYNMDQLLHIEQLARSMISVLLNPGNMAPTLVGMADKQFQCDVAVDGCLILNLLKCAEGGDDGAPSMTSGVMA
ncbi:hypothetical protein Bhyg_14535, partial [Pseudolycoriella hygida]